MRAAPTGTQGQHHRHTQQLACGTRLLLAATDEVRYQQSAPRSNFKRSRLRAQEFSLFHAHNQLPVGTNSSHSTFCSIHALLKQPGAPDCKNCCLLTPLKASALVLTIQRSDVVCFFTAHDEQHARALQRVQEIRTLRFAIVRIGGVCGLAAPARPRQTASDAVWRVVPHFDGSQSASWRFAPWDNSLRSNVQGAAACSAQSSSVQKRALWPALHGRGWPQRQHDTQRACAEAEAVDVSAGPPQVRSFKIIAPLWWHYLK